MINLQEQETTFVSVLFLLLVSYLFSTAVKSELRHLYTSHVKSCERKRVVKEAPSFASSYDLTFVGFFSLYSIS